MHLRSKLLAYIMYPHIEVLFTWLLLLLANTTPSFQNSMLCLIHAESSQRCGCPMLTVLLVLNAICAADIKLPFLLTSAAAAAVQAVPGALTNRHVHVVLVEVSLFLLHESECEQQSLQRHHIYAL